MTELHLPGLCADMQELVTSRKILDHAASHPVRLKVQKFHTRILQCMEEYKTHLMRASSLRPPHSELDLPRELLCSVAEQLCLWKRMLAVLNDSDRPRLEVEVQALARVIELMQSQPGPKYSWLFDEHEKVLVACLQSIRSEWEADISYKSKEEQQEALIQRWFNYYFILTQW